jgi:hypothetical protein
MPTSLEMRAAARVRRKYLFRDAYHYASSRTSTHPTTNGRSNQDLLSEAGAVDSDFLTLAGKGAVADFEDGFGKSHDYL